jgi:anti-sigma factor (TIGR02949 family)
MDDHNESSNCKSMLGNLSNYIDGDLQAELCEEIEQHLNGCENCRIVVNTLKKTVELYKHTSEPVDLPIEVRQRLYAKLKLATSKMDS